MKLTLSEILPEAGDARTFRFKSEQAVTWQPGQYLQYTLPHRDADDRGTSRWFTIASAPHEGFIQITTRLIGERASTFKQALALLEPGATIEAGEPEGDFVVDDPTHKMVFIAGGIGITPYRAILTDMQQRKIPINVSLLYGNRTAEFVFQTELDHLAEQNPGLKIRYIVEPETITDDLIAQTAGELKTTRIFTSGPEPMVEAFEQRIAALGVPDEHHKRDYFPGYTWPLQ